MRKTLFLPLLLISPLLFMGNSPAPYYTGENYSAENFEITNLEYQERENQNVWYSFTLEIYNKGDLYLQVDSLWFDVEDGNSGDFSIDTLRFNECIPPDTKVILRGYANREYSIDKIKPSDAVGFKVPKQTMSFSSAKLVNKVDAEQTYSGQTIYEYVYEIEGATFDDAYYNSMMVDYTIDGEHHATHEYSASKRFSFASTKDVEESDITINKIYLIQGRFKRYNQYSGIWLTIMISTGVTLFVGFLVSCIVVPLTLFSRKPWLKK